MIFFSLLNPLAVGSHSTEEFLDIDARKVRRHDIDLTGQGYFTEYTLTEEQYYYHLEMVRRTLIAYKAILESFEIPIVTPNMIGYCE